MRGLSALMALSGTSDIDDGSFDSSVANGYSVVDFHWGNGHCGWCEKMAPFYRAASNDPDLSGVNFYYYDTLGATANKADQYGVNGVPQLIIFKDGRQVAQSGYIDSNGDANAVKKWILNNTTGGSIANLFAPSAPSYSPPAQVATVSASSDQWGSPPDNSGWKKVYLDGKPAWNKNGQFASAGAAPANDFSGPGLFKWFTNDSALAPVGSQSSVSTSSGAQIVSAPAPIPSPTFSIGPVAPITATPVSSSSQYTQAVQVGSQTISVNAAADPNSWTYVAAYGNAKWQAVLLDGQQVFRNKSSGAFLKAKSIKGMAGPSVMGYLGAVTVNVPSYSSKGGGGGSDVSTVKTLVWIGGSVAAVALLGYLAVRLTR